MCEMKNTLDAMNSSRFEEEKISEFTIEDKMKCSEKGELKSRAEHH